MNTVPTVAIVLNAVLLVYLAWLLVSRVRRWQETRLRSAAWFAAATAAGLVGWVVASLVWAAALAAEPSARLPLLLSAVPVEVALAAATVVFLIAGFRDLIRELRTRRNDPHEAGQSARR